VTAQGVLECMSMTVPQTSVLFCFIFLKEHRTRKCVTCLVGCRSDDADGKGEDECHATREDEAPPLELDLVVQYSTKEEGHCN